MRTTDATELDGLAEALVDTGRRAGLDAVGIAPAEPFAGTRSILEARKAKDLHGGMHFTFGDPARSTDPSRTVPGAQALVVGARSYIRDKPDPASGDDRPLARIAR